MSDIAMLVPEPADAKLAAASLLGLCPAIAANEPVRLHVSGQTDEVEVPRSALNALLQVLTSFAHGESVAVLPAQAELTTQQAANVLNVSRPFLISLLDRGLIEYRTVGTHRRIKSTSLTRYMQEDDARRRLAADALSAETHERGFS